VWQKYATAGAGDATKKRMLQTRTPRYISFSFIITKATFYTFVLSAEHYQRNVVLDVRLVRQVSQLIRLVWNGRKGVNQLPITGTGSISKRWWQRMCFGHFGQIWSDSAIWQLHHKNEIHLWCKIAAKLLRANSLTKHLFFQRTSDKKCTKSFCLNLNCSREVKLIT